MKSASLDLIALANNLPTGDELRHQEKERIQLERQAVIDIMPRYLNSNQRRNLRKTIKKGLDKET